jgi:hypothetical protein
MILLIFTRILDLITTLLNTNKWGWEVEGNPVVQQIGIRGLFIPYQLFSVGVIIIVAELLPRYKRIIYVSMSSISLIVAGSNLFCFIFIR